VTTDIYDVTKEFNINIVETGGLSENLGNLHIIINNSWLIIIHTGLDQISLTFY